MCGSNPLDGTNESGPIIKGIKDNFLELKLKKKGIINQEESAHYRQNYYANSNPNK